MWFARAVTPPWAPPMEEVVGILMKERPVSKTLPPPPKDPRRCHGGEEQHATDLELEKSGRQLHPLLQQSFHHAKEQQATLHSWLPTLPCAAQLSRGLTRCIAKVRACDGRLHLVAEDGNAPVRLLVERLSCCWC
jgi:hypothetical protein